MMKSKKERSESVWLSLGGYRAAALKPEFGDHAIELERAIHEGIPAYPDPVRTDFYEVELEGGSAYIHVYPQRRVVYLVAHFPATLDSFSIRGFRRRDGELQCVS
jgi:hypothetical protein